MAKKEDPENGKIIVFIEIAEDDDREEDITDDVSKVFTYF